MYSTRQLVVRALKLTIATLVVAITQTCWLVFAITMPADQVRPSGWALHSILVLSGIHFLLGLVPLSIAFLISISGPNTVTRQISAVLISNLIGSAGYLVLAWLQTPVVWPVFVVGVVAYAVVLLPLRDMATGLRRRMRGSVTHAT